MCFDCLGTHWYSIGCLDMQSSTLNRHTYTSHGPRDNYATGGTLTDAQPLKMRWQDRAIHGSSQRHGGMALCFTDSPSPCDTPPVAPQPPWQTARGWSVSYARSLSSLARGTLCCAYCRAPRHRQRLMPCQMLLLHPQQAPHAAPCATPMAGEGTHLPTSHVWRHVRLLRVAPGPYLWRRMASTTMPCQL